MKKKNIACKDKISIFVDKLSRNIMIGQKIAILRTCRGFSQEFMANQLGIAQNTYSNLEKKEDKIPEEYLMKISEVLGVSVEDITNPSPIFMSFNNSPNSYVNADNNISVNNELIETLIAQLKFKDSIIEDLRAEKMELKEELKTLNQKDKKD